MLKPEEGDNSMFPASLFSSLLSKSTLFSLIDDKLSFGIFDFKDSVPGRWFKEPSIESK